MFRGDIGVGRGHLNKPEMRGRIRSRRKILPQRPRRKSAEDTEKTRRRAACHDRQALQGKSRNARLPPAADMRKAAATWRAVAIGYGRHSGEWRSRPRYVGARARLRAASSVGVSGRWAPLGRSPSWRGPMETRIRRRTSMPRASRMRRIWRFLPSSRMSSSQEFFRRCEEGAPVCSARFRCGRFPLHARANRLNESRRRR